MKDFNFSDYKTQVTLAGKEFTLDCTAETGDLMKNIGNEIKGLSEQVLSGEKSYDDVIKYGMEAIDKILGAGTCAVLFEGRKARIDDVCDICYYLMQAVSEFRSKRIVVLKANGRK